MTASNGQIVRRIAIAPMGTAHILTGVRRMLAKRSSASALSEGGQVG